MNKYLFFAVLCLTGLLLASCSSTRNYANFSKRKYYNFARKRQEIILGDKGRNVIVKQSGSTAISSSVSLNNNSPKKSEVLSKSAEVKIVKSPMNPAIAKNRLAFALKPKTVLGINENEPILLPPNKFITPDDKTSGNESSVKDRNTIQFIALIIVAIILPPFAILIYDNYHLSLRFFIDLVIDLYDLVAFFAIAGFAFDFYLIFGAIAAIFALLIVTGVFKAWGPKQGKSTSN